MFLIIIFIFIGSGDIIGYQTDNGISKHTETWIKAETELELCVFDCKSFDVFYLFVLLGNLATAKNIKK